MKAPNKRPGRPPSDKVRRHIMLEPDIDAEILRRIREENRDLSAVVCRLLRRAMRLRQPTPQEAA